MAQHAFGREHDQRFAPVAQGLAAQQMKILRGVRRLRNLDVVLRGELDETLDARAGVFRSLAFIAVRQKQHKAGEQVPFGFSGGDELVDDGLRHVYEVAELRLPQNQRFRIVAAVAVFESQHAGFGKSRVVDPAACLTGRDIFQRHIFVFVFDVDQHGVALVEGAAARVLAGRAELEFRLSPGSQRRGLRPCHNRQGACLLPFRRVARGVFLLSDECESLAGYLVREYAEIRPILRARIRFQLQTPACGKPP